MDNEIGLQAFNTALQ